uniref:Putative polysaccharide biosynthesis protein n=1 Tax=viral metagenome TaxID=1070528 RepID=A0A6M3LDH9_9ZZZZ
MRYLITGGTGSFGQAATKRLLSDPKTETIRIFSRNELNQARMRMSIPDPQEKLRFFIGDVRDRERLMKATKNVDIVLHAAALKRIEVGEYDPDEVIKTNVIGSKNVVDCAVESGVQKCLLVSSDKACDPSSTYGASKMMAERLFSQAQYTHGDPETTFVIVRYGNVFGSNGSVIPIFKDRIKQGLPLQVTHPSMTRFVIRMDEALDLVFLALAEAQSGEIFIKKLPSVSILLLAKLMSQNIEITGIGPGEKMHECLVSRNELCRTYDYGDYFIVVPLMSNKTMQSSKGVRYPYTSDIAEKLSPEKICNLIGEIA